MGAGYLGPGPRRNCRSVHRLLRGVRPAVDQLRPGHADGAEAGVVRGPRPFRNHQRHRASRSLCRCRRSADRRADDRRRAPAGRHHGSGLQVEVLPGVVLQSGGHAHSRRALLLGGEVQRHGSHCHLARIHAERDARQQVGEPEAGYGYRAGDGHGPGTAGGRSHRPRLHPGADRFAVSGAGRQRSLSAGNRFRRGRRRARQRLLHLG